MVGLELEVMAKKLDRFGWEKDRGTPAHDRIMSDWMDALQDFPLDEIKNACRACVIELGKRRTGGQYVPMPNEGDVLAHIMAERRRRVAALPKPREPEPVRAPEHDRRAAAARILAETGFAKRIGGAAE